MLSKYNYSSTAQNFEPLHKKTNENHALILIPKESSIFTNGVKNGLIVQKKFS